MNCPLETLTKTVRVSDPDRWYCRDTVTVKLCVASSFRGKVDVVLFVLSIDDFRMTWRYVCDENDEVRISYMYNVMKDFMFETMPSTISVKWLKTQGFKME